MSLRLNGSTSGYVEIDAPAAAGSNTLTLPDGNGTSGQYLQTNGSGALSWQTQTIGYTSLGETATTSGSGSTVTGIPSTATEVILILTDISCNSTTAPHLLLRMGNGSVDSGSNYTWTLASEGIGIQASTNTTSIRLLHTDFTPAANVYNGIIRMILGTSDVTGTSTLSREGFQTITCNFKYAGASTIDRVNLFTSSNFDAGKYEVLHNG